MIVVRVELHSAITGKVSEIGRMYISNTSVNDTPNVADYAGELLRKPNFKSVTRSGSVKDHRRLAEPVWSLVSKMLQNMGYGVKT